MPRYWGHIHIIEKNLKNDLYALAKPLAEKNRKDEVKLVIASTTMNPKVEKGEKILQTFFMEGSIVVLRR